MTRGESPTRTNRAVRVSTRLYGGLLRAYPEEFRRLFGGDLRQLFGDRCREGWESQGWFGLFSAWRGALLDLILESSAERFSRFRIFANSPRPAVGSRFPRWSGYSLEGVLQDVRFALRALLRHRVYSVLSLVALALAFGATTAVFSLVERVLLRPLPYPQADRLVILHQRPESGILQPASPLNYKDWRNQSKAFESMGATAQGWGAALTGKEGEPERLTMSIASSGFFRVLGVSPTLGRVFRPDEDETGSPPAAILSQSLWQSRFGSDPAVAGTRIKLNEVEHTIVGVMPGGFQLPESASQIWVSFPFLGQRLNQRGQLFLTVIGRLSPNAAIEQAQSEMERIAHQLEEAHPDTNSRVDIHLTPLLDHSVREVRPILWMLFAAVSLVLLIACSNVTSLMFSRIMARQDELAVRASLGAGRFRLVRQIITEHVLLFGAGATLGLVLAWAVMNGLSAAAASSVPRIDDLQLNLWTIIFAAATAFLSALLFGLLASITGTSPILVSDLRESSGGMGGNSKGKRARSVLVLAQVSLATLLLIGAGLLFRSMRELQSVESGFRCENVVTATVSLPGVSYPGMRSRQRFYLQLLQRAASLPGVESAGAISRLPLRDRHVTISLTVEGSPAAAANLRPEVGLYHVSKDFFPTLGVRLLGGRHLRESDDLSANSGVALINQALADKIFPGQEAVGRRVKMSSGDQAPWFSIIGVVESIRRAGLSEAPEPEFYLHNLQTGVSGLRLVLRSAADPAELMAGIRAIVRDLDPMLPVYDMATMEEVVSDSLVRRRLTLRLCAAFAGLALLLAMVGVYGVIALQGAQRRSEIAIRTAFGASRHDILLWMARQGMGLFGTALIMGFAFAWAVKGALDPFLFQIEPTDPLTYFGAGLILLAGAALSIGIPAGRASRIEPMKALRAE